MNAAIRYSPTKHVELYLRGENLTPLKYLASMPQALLYTVASKWNFIYVVFYLAKLQAILAKKKVITC
jgi:hypothetical protein